MQLLAAKFNQIATAIDTTNAQITALQAQLSELQEHQQQLLSVEQACQSALAQVGTALSMLNHVDPAEIPTFKAAVSVQFGTEAIAFLESATPTPAETVKPEPVAPIEPESGVEPTIDVEVTDVEVTDVEVTDADAAIASTAAATPGTAKDIEGLLNKMTIQSIRKLAVTKKVGGSGTRSEIASRLAGIVTQDDIWQAS